MIDIKKVLLQSAGTPENDAAVLLSAGVDSSSVLFALLEAGKRVTAYSFCLDDRTSTDVKYAQITAKEFGVPFVHIHRNLSRVYKKCWVAPYMTQEMIDELKGTTWDEVNRPHQKQPILDAFPEQFKRIKIFKHTNFQKGDSGISEHFEKLLHTDLNVGKHKSVVGIYNYLVKNLSKENDELLDI